MLSIADSFRPRTPDPRNRVPPWSCPRWSPACWPSARPFVHGAVQQLPHLHAVPVHPWTAINLVDFYLVRRGHYSVRAIFDPTASTPVGMAGIGAYLVGFVAMIPFFSTGWFVGPVASALGDADIAMFVGLR